jgi:hypothetical protein
LNRGEIPYKKHSQLNRFPAVLIGQLGVTKPYSKKETNGNSTISEELLNFVKKWIVDSDIKAACRFLILDAYNVPNILNYYLKNCFQYLFSNEFYERKNLKLEENAVLKTRLMFFDLISI